MKDETLSSKIHWISGVHEKHTKLYGIRVKDVKDFIQRIEMTMLVTPSPTERGEFILWLSKEIRKLAGDALIHSPLKSHKSTAHTVVQKEENKEDTPEGTSKTVVSSGTHGSHNPACTNCGKPESEHRFCAEGKLTEEGLYCEDDKKFIPKDCKVNKVNNLNNQQGSHNQDYTNPDICKRCGMIEKAHHGAFINTCKEFHSPIHQTDKSEGSSLKPKVLPSGSDKGESA